MFTREIGNHSYENASELDWVDKEAAQVHKFIPILIFVAIVAVIIVFTIRSCYKLCQVAMGLRSEGEHPIYRRIKGPRMSIFGDYNPGFDEENKNFGQYRSPSFLSPVPVHGNGQAFVGQRDEASTPPPPPSGGKNLRRISIFMPLSTSSLYTDEKEEKGNSSSNNLTVPMTRARKLSQQRNPKCSAILED